MIQYRFHTQGVTSSSAGMMQYRFHTQGIKLTYVADVKVMALTATATIATRKAIMHRLGMKNAVVISVTPNKENLFYVLREKYSIEEFASNLCKVACCDRTHAGKIIVFCRHYGEYTQLYSLMRYGLGPQITEPIGTPDDNNNNNLLKQHEPFWPSQKTPHKKPQKTTKKTQLLKPTPSASGDRFSPPHPPLLHL